MKDPISGLDFCTAGWFEEAADEASLTFQARIRLWELIVSRLEPVRLVAEVDASVAQAIIGEVITTCLEMMDREGVKMTTHERFQAALHTLAGLAGATATTRVVEL